MAAESPPDGSAFESLCGPQHATDRSHLVELFSVLVLEKLIVSHPDYMLG
jgi:hypothetical protein